MDDPVEQLMWDAADIIEDRGWRQGFGEKNQLLARAPICAAEALGLAFRARYGFSSEHTWGLQAMDRIKERTGSNGVTTWNDEPGRTKQEVLDVLRNFTPTTPL